MEAESSRGEVGGGECVKVLVDEGAVWKTR